MKLLSCEAYFLQESTDFLRNFGWYKKEKLLTAKMEV